MAGWDDFESSYSDSDYQVPVSADWQIPTFDSIAPTYNFPPAYSPDLGGGYTGMPLMGGLSFSQPQQQSGGYSNFAPQQQPMPQQNTGFLQSLLTPQSLLGLGGMVSGLVGTLAGGGKGQATSPQMSMAQRNAGTQTDTALHQLNPFVTGQSPLQQQQMSLLNALASGQGLPPGYAQLVEQAFQPQMGSIVQQAIESARRRGFAGGAELLNSGPGGAIAGPMLADLQGQMAQAKLGLMQSLPGLYNTPTAIQGGFAGQQAQGYNNLMRSYPTGTQTSQPLGPQIGQAIGQGLTGIGSALGQQNQQQNFYNALMKMSQGGGMSYDPSLG